MVFDDSSLEEEAQAATTEPHAALDSSTSSSLALPTLMDSNMDTVRASNTNAANHRANDETTASSDIASLFATPVKDIVDAAEENEGEEQHDFLASLTSNKTPRQQKYGTTSTTTTPSQSASVNRVSTSTAPPSPMTFMTPLRSNRTQSGSSIPLSAVESQHSMGNVVVGPLPSSLRRHRRIHSRDSSTGSVDMLQNVSFEAIRDHGVDNDDYHSSLGDTSLSYQHEPTDDDFDDDNDNDSLSLSMSNKSLDSSVIRTAALTIPKLAAVSTGKRGSIPQYKVSTKTLQHGDRRVSLKMDIETGKKAARGQRVVRRSRSNMEPGAPRLRRRRGFKHMLQKVGHSFKTNSLDDARQSIFVDDNGSDGAGATVRHGRLMVESKSVIVPDSPHVSGGKIERYSEHEETQYRLTALTTQSSRFVLRKMGFYESMTHENGGFKCLCGWHPNLLIQRYLFWAFRNKFVLVLLSAAGFFYFFTLIFAVLLFFLGMHKPSCIQVNGVDFGKTQAPFMDAYALSWTTYSTVGYGLIFPGTTATTINTRDCTGISILTALESFFGILFASMFGAVFFAKVVRVSSHAQVNFSDAIIVKYGTGITGVDDMYEESSEEEEEEEGQSSSIFPPAHINKRWSSPGELSGIQTGDKSASFRYKRSKLPCPILEFRLMNLLEGTRGGEIIDASLNIVASIDESQAALGIKRSVGSRRRRGKKGKRRARRTTERSRPEKDDEIDVKDEDSVRRLQESVQSMVASQNKVTRIEEDVTCKFLPKRIFAKLEIDSAEHPFFRRIWIIRHVLNHHSPLLRQEAKELVRLNGGHWPQELNNPEGVRASFHFDQILVSLSGTSNVDANSVYAQKVYDYVDVCVGYSFCNMLFRHDDGAIGVDATLLNDVKEQDGGGGEDLDARLKEQDSRDVIIL